MNYFLAILFGGIFLLGCQKKDVPEKAPLPDPRVEELRTKIQQAHDEAKTLRDPQNLWLTPDDCDGALWTGKYGAVLGGESIAWDVAEYPEEPGRFARRPLTSPCAADTPSWSRDMGIGLLTYAWRQRDKALLERHERYGFAHDWSMGEPFGDGRAYYTPAMRGKLYQTLLALGGPDNIQRHWPDLYPTGLTDFQAHLQVMGIWLRGEVDEAFKASGTSPGHSGDAGPAPTTDDPAGLQSLAVTATTQSALDILRAQAQRDPRDPLFQAVYGMYTGDMAPAITACLAEDQYAGEYVRCEVFRKCQLSAWLFACDLVSRRFPK